MVMTTDAPAAQPMFAHFVPEVEPPIGSVASFHFSFASGAGSSTGYLMRGPAGWSSTPDPARHDILVWEALVDLDARNADTQQRNPGSTARFVAVEVRIHSTPPVDRAGDRARLVKLEHAVFCAAERLGIPTENASHTDLVADIAVMAVKGI